MANPSKDTQFYSITTKTSVPAPANIAGTVATVGTAIIGTTTLFKSGGTLQMGSLVVVTPQVEVRRVIRL